MVVSISMVITKIEKENMEGDTKRVKLDIVDDGPVLKYLTGELVDPKDIEQNWNIENQILLLLLQTGSFADTPASDVLKKLEKLNSKWYQFIAKSQAWKVLFSKKYPEQFHYAIEKPEWFREVKAKLDAISVNPGREHTYWKRWYELLSSEALTGKMLYEATWFSHLNSELQDNENDRDDVFLMYNDPKLAFHHIDKTQNIVFICFANIKPNFMITINLDSRDRKVIPYDKTVLGDEIVRFKILGENDYERVVFESLDGFTVFFLTSYAFHARGLRQRFVLVSSCQQCQVNDAQYVEKNLRGLFCSERCQREFRLN